MNEADTTFSHVAICVTDLEKSTRFYVGSFGLELDHHVEIGAPFEVLTELPVINGKAAFFLKNGTKLELVAYEEPETIGSAERRPMNQLGLTHIAFIVANLDVTMAQITDLGGTVMRDTRVSGPYGDMVFATDPDGVRLELWQKPA